MAGVGKPPKFCPECRAKGFKVPTSTKGPRPVPSYAEAMAKVQSAPEVVDTLTDEEEANPYQYEPKPLIPSTGSEPASMLEQAIREIAQQSVSRTEISEMIDAATGRALETADRLITDNLTTFDKAMNARVADIVAQIGSTSLEVKRLNGSLITIDNAHKLLPTLLSVLTAEEHAFLVGPAGSGKSTLAEHAANALGVSFASMSVGPMTSNVKLFGYMNATGEYVTTEFRKVYESGGIFLLDEMDNGHPGLIAELNQALSNGYCAFGDQMVKRHDEFRMIATGNTFGTGADRQFVGRNKLDAATLDRFTVIECPVDEMLERTIAMAYSTPGNMVERWVNYCQQIRRNVTERNLPIIVSPRATIGGARMLSVGMAWSDVADMRLWKDVSKADRRSLDA